MSNPLAPQQLLLRLALIGAAVMTATMPFSFAGEKEEEAAKEAVAARAAKLRAEEKAVAKVGIIGPFGGNVIINGGINPDNLAGSDSNNGVFVRDSQAALDKLALAQKMERLKEWNKSADLYQEVLEKYRDRVVPSITDPDKKVTQYTSITLPVQEQLAKWPQAGLDVYRARYETPATTLLDGARPDDLDTLSTVYDRFFVTDAGKLAGSRLIDLYLERGEYRAAASVGDRLLKWHPNLLAERAGVQFRTALALHLAGDAKAANERLAQIQKQFPAERGIVRGKDVILADALAAELTSPISAEQTLDADSWPMFCGSSDRARVAHAEGKAGARLFSVPLSKPSWGNINPQQRQQLEGAVRHAVETGGTIGVMPITDRGELFFQDGARVYGVNLENGLPLSGWVQTYGGSGQYVMPSAFTGSRTHQLTLTATDKLILAVMGQPDRQGMMLQVRPDAEARLVCLNRETGKENWTVALSQLPEEAAGQRTLQLTGSPLVVGDSVMVVGRAGKQAQFEDCYVLCFELATGKYRWSSYVASANTVGPMMGMGMVVSGENTTHLSYANGRIFVQTNLGALACLDAFSGTIIWLDIYTRPAGATNPNINRFLGGQPMPQTQHRPWAFNPVMVVDGRVFTLPSEGKSVLIYDADSGAPIKQLQMEQVLGADASGDYDTLLGVIGDNLYVTGEKSVVCVNWKTYNADRFNEDSYVWSQALDGTPIRGRAFLTAESIYIPLEDRLYQIDLPHGKVQSVYPNMEKIWDDGETPGNVLVTGDHVVLATATSVDVYTDLSLQLKKLDHEIAQAPSDPQPHLRYAEVLFVAGERDAAITRLDEAVVLLGGINAMQSGPGRDRVFGDVLAFAHKLESDPHAQDKDQAQDKVVVNSLYDRAAWAAATPGQQIQYHLQRAKFCEASNDAAGAVKLYQQILSDPTLRSSPLTDDTSSLPVPAEIVAGKAIGRQMGLHPGVYAPIEREASKSLEQARTARDNAGARLLDVAETYPNSSVAGPAMLEAADAYETAGNPRLAIAALRQLYFKDPDGPLKPRLLESMARNYLALPNRADVAAARLAQGAAMADEQKLSKPLRLPDGRILQNVTFTAALEELRRLSAAQAARSLPDMHIPIPTLAKPGEPRHPFPHPFLPQVAADVVSDIKALVPASREFARSDRLVAWSTTGKLLIFPAAKAAPMASIGGLADDPTGCAWLGGNLLAWSPNQVMLLGGDAAQPLWTIDVRQLPALEVARGHEAPAAVAPLAVAAPVRFGNPARINGRIAVAPANPPVAVNKPAVPNGPEQVLSVRPVGDRVLIWTTSGRLLSADLITGKIAWQMRLSDRAFDRLVANEDFTVVRLSNDGSVRLVALDTFSGHVLGSKVFIAQSGLVPVNLALADDGTLVYTLPDRLCLKNLYTPWPDASDREVAGPPGAPPFAGASQPDQLIVAEGRILGLATSGAENGSEKYVRVHSLETGNPVPLKFATAQGNQEVDHVLSAGKSWAASLRVVGSQLYVFGPQGLFSYNLDNPALAWNSSPIIHEPDWNTRDLFVGQHYLGLLLDQTPAAMGGAAPQPTFLLQAYGRYPKAPGSPGEAGRLDFHVTLSDPATIVGPWQAVDGAICYLTADNKLHLLRGSREDAGPVPAPAK